ncbi:MAG: hypothetical protein AB1540_14855 [Bdellovibrionota bacterium]
MKRTFFVLLGFFISLSAGASEMSAKECEEKLSALVRDAIALGRAGELTRTVYRDGNSDAVIQAYLLMTKRLNRKVSALETEISRDCMRKDLKE